MARVVLTGKDLSLGELIGMKIEAMASKPACMITH